QSLVAAEVAFARRAATRNTRDAFVENLAPDAVLFDPLPVNGHDLYAARPVTKAKLVWTPAYAAIAASGNFGVTSGPWEYTPTGDLHYLREGDPARSDDDARNAMSATPAHSAFRPIGEGVATSGDLGYTYGVREDSSADRAPDSTVYVHVWRRAEDGGWKVSA